MTWPLSPNSVRNARERKPETTMTLLNVMPEITQRSLLPHSLCLNSVATHWPTLRKGEIKLHVSDEGVSKNSLTYFNVTHFLLTPPIIPKAFRMACHFIYNYFQTKPKSVSFSQLSKIILVLLTA